MIGTDADVFQNSQIGERPRKRHLAQRRWSVLGSLNGRRRVGCLTESRCTASQPEIGKSGAVETKDEEMLELGDVYFSGFAYLFIPEQENEVDHSSASLRELADLMDGLEKEKAAVAGK